MPARQAPLGVYQKTTCLDYIHNNPVECGYVDLPEHWRYSSAAITWGKRV
jgi:hypothetical protein